MTASGLTFLAPMTGILTAAIAGPILVLLYFLKLRRRPVRISSILLWSQAVQDLQVNEPFRWIRLSWLLVLQLLALACLALALARPVAGIDEGRGARVIVLVDHSASMSARDGVGAREGAKDTRLEEAKRRGKELIERLVGGGRAEAMVVSFAGTAVTRAEFTRDRGLLRNAIDAIEPTDQPADFDAALRVVAGQIARGEGEAVAPPRVVLLSDGDVSPTPGAAEGVGRAEFELISVGPDPASAADNVGIVVMNARRDFEDPGMVRVFVRVRSTLREAASVLLRCELDGESVATTNVALAAADVTTGVSDASHTFELTNTTGGMVVVSVMRGDVLASDNAAGLRLSPTGAPTILLVRPAPAATASEFALVDALAALEPQELRQRTSEEYARAPEEALAGVDLVVFDQVRPERLPAVASLSLGATLPIAGLGVSEDPEAEPSGFAFWQRGHPVLRAVGLGSVRIERPMRVTLPAESPGATITPIASGVGGPLIVSVEQGTMRRVVVGFALARTNWWRSDSFPVFIANAVEHLTLRGEQDAGSWWRTTEAVLVRAAAGAEVIARGPGGRERRATAGGDGSANLGVLPLAGVYTLENAEGVRSAAVNLADARETALRTSRSVSVAGETIASGSVSALAPREVWPWFVAAALVLLTLDWVIFGWRSRV